MDTFIIVGLLLLFFLGGFAIGMFLGYCMGETASWYEEWKLHHPRKKEE